MQNIKIQNYSLLSKEDVPTWCKQFYYDFIS